MPKHKYGAYAGEREVDGKKVRFASRMEFNYYLYLRWLKGHGEIRDFEYQPAAFDFRARAKERPDLWKREWLPQKASYRPDFRVTEKDGSVEYVETVGMLRPGHKRNFKLLARLFPGVKLKVVTKVDYKEIERMAAKVVPGWESGGFRGQGARFGRRRVPHIDEIGGTVRK
jgi:hypothetical protein